MRVKRARQVLDLAQHRAIVVKCVVLIADELEGRQRHQAEHRRGVSALVADAFRAQNVDRTAFECGFITLCQD
jgi:hypothetical protein